MQRRQFITLVGGTVIAWPLSARAEQPRQVRRIGILMPYPKNDAESQSYVRAFRQELARLGWSEGGNVQFDERWSTDNMDLVRTESCCTESGRHCYRWRSCHSNPDEIDSFDCNRSRVNQRSDRVWRGGKSRAAGPQRDWIFARRVLDLWQDAGDNEETCSGHLPRRHDV